MDELDAFGSRTEESSQTHDDLVAIRPDDIGDGDIDRGSIEECGIGTDYAHSGNGVESRTVNVDVSQDENDHMVSSSIDCAATEQDNNVDDEREIKSNLTEYAETATSDADTGLHQEADAGVSGKGEEKAHGGSNRKNVYVALALAIAAVVAILLFAHAGSRLDASARLDQITINYPSEWILDSANNSIYVNGDNIDEGLVGWATSGDQLGQKGIDYFTSSFSDSIDFKGSLKEVDINGATAYRQAISVDNMTGEALFVTTDEGTTFVVAAMPSNDERLQGIIGNVLDSAKLSPGTKCTITLKSDGDTTDTVVVYDYGYGATCNMNVVGSNNGKETPTSGSVLTSWEIDDPRVSAELNDEGVWEITGVTGDVTLTAVWTAAHKVTFADGQGNEIATVGVLDGEPAAAPDSPTRTGFAFDGWDADFSKVTSDITVNAKWVEAHTVTFTDGVGNTLATLAVKDGEAAKAPSEPSRGGYIFSGWDTDFSNVTEDITVNAKWDSEFKATLRGLGDFEQTTINGYGDDVIDIPCAGKPCLMIISNDGSRNFVVKTLDSSGNSVDLLVNTIGAYNGTVTTYQDYEDSHLVEVKSSGSWSITFAPLADMQDASNGSTFSGDNVVAISEGSMSKVHFSNDGSHNFVVKGFGLNSSKLLVNEIGNYNGTVAWGEPQCFFFVHSNGTWSISW